MKQAIKAFLHSLPYIGRLHEQVKNQGIYPAGHYYSPIPSREDVLESLESRKHKTIELPDIQLNSENQFALLQEYSLFQDEIEFPETENPSFRYHCDQPWFCYTDAIFLYCFLRKHKPKRIIEVGSGFSSAVILDTVDRCFSDYPEITFIEPYPDRLKNLLKPSDSGRVQIVEKKVQDVSIDLILALEAGDLLFIDSSHVVKCGSDLHMLMFEVLPLLPPGIFVHFHDVFYPFNYPSEWFEEGRYWNENYFLRAFLSYNSEWSIYFFNSYLGLMFDDFIKSKMPLCIDNPGGSLYIQRGQID